MEIKGKYNNCKIFTDNVEQEAVGQIINILSQEIFKDSKIRIMPDVHAGKGCVIGFTSTFNNKIIPNLVGVDISCGIICVELGKIDINLEDLDIYIRDNVPSGMNINNKKQTKTFDKRIKDLKCFDSLNSLERILLSIGTLGGGNHFIELSKDSDDNKYLLIHSGSRNLGKQVAEYYQNIAKNEIINKRKIAFEKESSKTIEHLKSIGQQCMIKDEVHKLRQEFNLNIPEDLAYLEDENFKNYLHDVKICQEYATANRRIMAIKILEHLKIKEESVRFIETIHNYIDLENQIIRKGAVSAQKDEHLIIPINMRDGSLLCVGKGNADWNYSAPHGAGRLMSRKKAKEIVSLEEFKETMEGIYSTSVRTSTLDESPFAYKPIEEIISNISETVEIKKILKPIYNFKA